MLVGGLRAGGRRVAVQQIVCRLAEPIDVARLRDAWDWTARRHPALRTSFLWRNLDRPRQRVTPSIPLPFDVREVRERSRLEREAALERFLELDRERGFDLGEAPLFRLTHFVHAPADHVLVWTFHHVILDGRSHTLVLRDAFERYDRGDDYAPAPPRPFREHCEHVAARDVEPARAFWRRHLSGFDEATPLPVPAAHSRRGGRHEEHEDLVDADTVAALRTAGEIPWLHAGERGAGRVGDRAQPPRPS